MGFNSLFDVLKAAASRYPKLGKRLEEAEALGRWELAVGAVIAKHAKAVRVDQGVLYVEVDHPIWKSELHYRKRQILDLLNQGRPEEAFTRPAGKAKSRVPIALPPAKETLTDIFLLEKRKSARNNAS